MNIYYWLKIAAVASLLRNDIFLNRPLDFARGDGCDNSLLRTAFREKMVVQALSNDWLLFLRAVREPPPRGNDPIRGWIFRFSDGANGKKLDGWGRKWYPYIVNPVRGCAFRFSNGVKIYEPPFLLSQESRVVFSKEVNYGQFKYRLFTVSTP